MVKKYAIVRNNVVENVIVIDGDASWYSPVDADFIDVTGVYVGPEFIMNEDGTFSAPPAPTEE